MRELLEEKDEGLTAFKEMEAAALRMQEDIIKRCAERDTLLERISVLETSVAELNTRNEELEKMLCRLFLSGTWGTSLTDAVTALTGSSSSLVPPACP